MSCLAFVKKDFLRIKTIYLSSYMTCGIQYRGEIAVYENLTIDIHRRGKSACQILIDQFKNDCPGGKFTVQLQKLLGQL